MVCGIRSHEEFMRQSVQGPDIIEIGLTSSFSNE